MNFKITLFTLALLLTLNATQASLTVQSFSCNNGFHNVQATVPFTCSAVIQNDDVNAVASLTSVTLTSSNGWTAVNSYDGSFSGNSVPQGGSVVVTFSGIIATTSGASKTFSDILINDASSNPAVLPTAIINVIAIKTLTATASSTLTGSGSFPVDAQANLGGRANVTFLISVSGCSLPSDEIANVAIGTVEDSNALVSWNVNRGTSTCYIVVTASASASPVSIQSTKTFGNLPSSSSSDSASSAGGGGAGSALNATNETKNVTNTVKTPENTQATRKLAQPETPNKLTTEPEPTGFALPKLTQTQISIAGISAVILVILGFLIYTHVISLPKIKRK